MTGAAQPMPSYPEAVGMLRAKASPSTANLAVRNTASLALRMTAWCDESLSGRLSAQSVAQMVAGVAQSEGDVHVRPAMDRSPLRLLLSLPGSVSAGKLDRVWLDSPAMSRKKAQDEQLLADRHGLSVPSLLVLSYYDPWELSPDEAYEAVRGTRNAVAGLTASVTPERLARLSGMLSWQVRLVAQSVRDAEAVMGPRTAESVSRLEDSVSRLAPLAGKARSSLLGFMARPSPASASAARESLSALEGLYDVDSLGVVRFEGCAYGRPFPAHRPLADLMDYLRAMWVRPSRLLVRETLAAAEGTEVPLGEQVRPETQRRLILEDWYDCASHVAMPTASQMSRRALWHLARSRRPPALWT